MLQVSGVLSTGSDACPDAEQLAAMIDGRLNGEDRANVEQHLAGCHICREVLAETVCLDEAEPVVAGNNEATGPLLPTGMRWAWHIWSRAADATR
jgi:predicted anti-sigma-YlaC factor YlaD